MVGQWQIVEGVLAQALVVDLHVVVDSLLVTKMEVVFLMIRRDHVMAGVVLFLLFLFIFGSVLALTSHVGVATNLLERFVTTGRHASVCFFEGGQCLLFGAFGSRDQILD